jgi:hypothetical protein
MTTHAAYDVYFDKLCDLLINGDKFDADILEDNDFTKCIIEIKLYLKGVRRDFIRDSSKRKVLLQLFASGDEIEDFWDPAKYNEFLDVWDAAVSDGFLPDCVCHSGPAPSIPWDPVLVTPVKAIGKRCVTPGPKGPVVSVPLPSPKPGIHTPRATPVQPGFLHPAAAPPADPNPAQVQQALLDFLQGGGQGAPMPRSPFPGTLPTPDLPLLSAPKSE